MDEHTSFSGYCKNGIQAKHFLYAMSLIDGKWKLTIMFWLWHKEVLRYGELKKNLGKISHKMLSCQLKELETDGIILRREFPQVPPKVEYALTEKGLSLMPVLAALCRWGHENMPKDWEPH